MKKAYLSIGFKSRHKRKREIDIIKAILTDHSISLFIFADEYHFSAKQEKEMMQQAFTEIDNCDLLIAEVSEKAIGVGIELGYASAKQKPVIYIRNSAAEHSTTASGTADHAIVYENEPDLAAKLNTILTQVDF